MAPCSQAVRGEWLQGFGVQGACRLHPTLAQLGFGQISPKMGNAAALGLQCFWVWVLRGGVSLAPLCLQGPVCIPCLEAQSCCQLERSPEEGRKKNNTKIEKATKQALVVSVVTLLSFHC